MRDKRSKEIKRLNDAVFKAAHSASIRHPGLGGDGAIMRAIKRVGLGIPPKVESAPRRRKK